MSIFDNVELWRKNNGLQQQVDLLKKQVIDVKREYVSLHRQLLIMEEIYQRDCGKKIDWFREIQAYLIRHTSNGVY